MAKQVIRSCVTYPLASSLEYRPRVTLLPNDWGTLMRDIGSNVEIRAIDKEGVVLQLLPFLTDDSVVVKEAKWIDVAIHHDVIRIDLKGSSQRAIYVNVDSINRTVKVFVLLAMRSPSGSQ